MSYLKCKSDFTSSSHIKGFLYHSETKKGLRGNKYTGISITKEIYYNFLLSAIVKLIYFQFNDAKRESDM